MSSGRGRGVSNAPAWMTRGEGGGDRDDYGRRAPHSDCRGGGRDRHPQSHHHRGPPPHRGGPPHRGPPGRGPPHRHNNNNRNGGIVFRSWEEERDWVEERRRKRKARATESSKWDVPPTAEQATLDAQAIQLNNPAATDFSGQALDSGLPQQTRHARRLYLGNLPHGLMEQQVHGFFRQAIEDALEGERLKEDPILSVYINHERRFAFLEFKTVEMTTACLNLDGLSMAGRGKVTIKRPNDYNPAMAPPVHPGALPNLNVAKLGIVSTTVPDGPNKIFIGGLHYHLTEDQVLELLSAFGKVKAFHLLRNDDPMSQSNYSKGYGFAEYADPNVTQVAVLGLHGMDLGGGKTLTARIAAAKDSPAAILPTNGTGVGNPNVIGGYNVEELIDAAMGLRDMPTAPTYGATAAPLMTTGMMAQPHGMMQQPMVGMMQQQQYQQASALDIANAALQAAFPGQQQQPPVSEVQTRILVLLNMVTDQDLSTTEDHQALSEEVRQECAKFGNLLSMKIPRPLEGYEPSAVHKIFLEYATTQDAGNARNELAGRAFGTNVVEATYYSEQDYLANKLR